jgi:hypothetical protein
LLQAIDRLGKDIEYYAVDLSLPELERTFKQIPIGKQIHLDMAASSELQAQRPLSASA